MSVLGLLLLAIGGLLSLVGGVMLVVAAFRVSAMWGLIVLLVPFGALVFVVMYWEDAKRGFFVGLAGTGAAAIAFFAFVGSAMNSIGAQIEEADRRERARVTRPLGAAPSAPAEQATPQTQPVVTAPSTERTPLPAVPPPPEKGIELLADLPTPAVSSVVRLDQLERHRGEELVFVDRDGRSIRATLVSAGASDLVVERVMSGGTIRHPIERASLKEVRLAN